MRPPLFLAATTALCLSYSHADTILQTKSSPFTWDQTNDQGSWNNQSVTLSDKGFQLKGTPLTNNVRLNSFSVIRDTERSDSKQALGNLWLAVLDTKGSTSSVVAHSQHTINIAAAKVGAVCTWRFKNDSILSSHRTYYFTVFKDDGDGVFETDGSDAPSIIRIETHNSSIIAGDARASATAGPHIKDWVMKIGVSNTTREAKSNLSSIISVNGITLSVEPE